MLRGLWAVVVAAAVCGGASLLLMASAYRGTAGNGLALVSAFATLFLAGAAAAFAWRALKRSDGVAAEIQRLARSIDAAIGDFSARSDRDKAALAELNAFVAREIDQLSARVASGSEFPAEPEAAPQGANIVPHPAAQRGRRPAIVDPDGAGIETALQRTMASGRAELSLQPIISVASGAASGFEVHVHIEPEIGQPIDIRRLKRPVSGIDSAAFERLVVLSAAEAARRRLGESSTSMPLHVAVSDALLRNGPELDAVTELFSRYPLLAQSVVLSFPAELAEPGTHGVDLERLAPLDLRLAAEDWSGTPESLALLKRAGARFVKLPADRLLDRAKPRKAGAAGATLLELAAASGITVIATEVRTDEDAVGLIDLGVDLMTGARFSGPRRLKPEGGRPGKVARS